MDTELLVEKQIEDGQRLIDQLIRDDIGVSVGFWVKANEEGLWQLYIASPSINPEKLGEAYRRVFTSLNKLTDCSVTLSDLKLINGSNPIALAAMGVRDRHPEKVPTRYHENRLGNTSIHEAYIYPPLGKGFSGSDEIKDIFPSAEVFTIPVLFEDGHPANFRAFMGAINAETFEGRQPGTVLFLGSKRSSGQPLTELSFVYRPEGWNQTSIQRRDHMNEFVRVLGNDPQNNGGKAYCYVHRNSICRIYPVYAEVKDGRAYLCTDTHPKAQIVSYTLIDLHGNEYSCGRKEELAKLGIREKNGQEEPKPKGRIGFVTGSNDQQMPIDTEAEIPSAA